MMMSTLEARAPRPIFGRKQSTNGIIRAVVRHALIICALVILLYPLVWMVAASFRPSNQIFTTLGLFSSHPTLANYRGGWSGGQLNFSRYFLNSFLVAILSIAGNLFACSVTAYAFARLNFPGKKVLFALLLGTMLLPFQVTLVPQYIVFNKLGWINTYLPLVVPHWFGVNAFFIFLMVQFIRSLPRELDDSARIDGCGHFRIFSRIIMPLALPAIGVVALFSFVWSWNDFLGPLLYLSRTDLWTVPLGLKAFLDSTGQSAYGELFAMSTLSLAPIIGFFVLSQRLLIEGISTTGIK